MIIELLGQGGDVIERARRDIPATSVPKGNALFIRSISENLKT